MHQDFHEKKLLSIQVNTSINAACTKYKYAMVLRNKRALVTSVFRGLGSFQMNAAIERLATYMYCPFFCLDVSHFQLAGQDKSRGRKLFQ